MNQRRKVNELNFMIGQNSLTDFTFLVYLHLVSWHKALVFLFLALAGKSNTNLSDWRVTFFCIYLQWLSQIFLITILVWYFLRWLYQQFFHLLFKNFMLIVPRASAFLILIVINIEIIFFNSSCCVLAWELNYFIFEYFPPQVSFTDINFDEAWNPFFLHTLVHLHLRNIKGKRLTLLFHHLQIDMIMKIHKIITFIYFFCLFCNEKRNFLFC